MAAVAMTPNPVQTLQEEAVCAICLDYFTDPVSIGCGHNFCRPLGDASLVPSVEKVFLGGASAPTCSWPTWSR